MPLFLIKVKRWTRVVQYGDFSVEADDFGHADSIARSDLAGGTADVHWRDLDMTNRKPGVTKIDDIEVLADGTEDISGRIEE